MIDKTVISIKEILSLVGVSSTQYYRWKTEFRGCTFFEGKRCKITRSNQLTLIEQEKLIQFAKDQNFKKFSTISLMFYCKRNKILTCSLDSWYKHRKLYGIKRNTFKHIRKGFKEGIRAWCANEIWHIDLTEVRTKEG
ncbi:hypothetical protein OAT67_02480 [Bacteriovoracaceae bacterium]|nr:hypothetical protein [Bacteriovoracaceae bacterium]